MNESFIQNAAEIVERAARTKPLTPKQRKQQRLRERRLNHKPKKSTGRTRRDNSMMPKASKVKITHADGTVEMRPSYKTRKSMVQATRRNYTL